MSHSMQGKAVLVTGASSGIGQAAAVKFAQNGASVALLARREDRLQTLARELGELGVKAIPIAENATATSAHAGTASTTHGEPATPRTIIAARNEIE